MINRTRIVSGLLINDEKKILLRRRPIGEGALRPGMWETVGGEVERAEGDEHALIRAWHNTLQVGVTVGRRLVRTNMMLEEPITITLYQVVLVGDQAPRLFADLAGDDGEPSLLWVEPEFAIQYLPCAYSFQHFLPTIRGILKNLVTPLASVARTRRG